MMNPTISCESTEYFSSALWICDTRLILFALISWNKIKYHNKDMEETRLRFAVWELSVSMFYFGELL